MAAYPHLHRLALSLKQSREADREEEGRFFPPPPPPSTPPQTGLEVVHGLFTLRTPVRVDRVRKLITCDLPWLQGMQFWVASFAEEEGRLPGELVVSTKEDRRDRTSEMVQQLAETPTVEKLTSLVVERPARIYAYSQMRAFLADLQRGQDRSQDYRRIVRYFCGLPGAGKSYSARQWLAAKGEAEGINDEIDPIHFSSAGFALGCRGSQLVLLDDWDPRSLPPESWNRLFDSYRTTLNVKGSEFAWRAMFIAITRTHPPEMLGEYGLRRDEIVQIVRRFEAIVVCSADEDEDGTIHHITEEVDPQSVIRNLTPNP